jgi:cytochrome P450
VSGEARASAAIDRARTANAEMREYVGRLVDERRRAPRSDLLTRLAQADDAGERLSDDEILGFFQLLMLAGHETTTNLISNAVLSFIEHPDQLALVRVAPELLVPAIEEVLRYRSPVQAVFRATRREANVNGQAIPPGQLVLLMLGAANRDPRQFDSAGAFDVTRHPNTHIAFGHGAHYCIGAPLARLESRIALELLLARWARFERATEAPWAPREAFHVHGPSRLALRFESARTPNAGAA